MGVGGGGVFFLYLITELVCECMTAQLCLVKKVNVVCPLVYSVFATVFLLTLKRSLCCLLIVDLPHVQYLN